MGEQQRPIVVVVDDEPAIVDVVCEVLVDAEVADASGCPHGHRAHLCIRRKRPALVILDVQMPDVDGVEIFRQLRADPDTRAIPVIFCTANAHKLVQWLPDYQALGAHLLPKPFDIGRLIDVVERALAL